MTEILHTLVAAGITHVVGLPYNTSAPLFDALSDHLWIRLVTVTREGEAFAIASGLWLGGASPLVVIQNTGLLESGDSLRGTATRMGAPIPILITGRGYSKMKEAGQKLSRVIYIQSQTIKFASKGVVCVFRVWYANTHERDMMVEIGVIKVDPRRGTQ